MFWIMLLLHYYSLAKVCMEQKLLEDRDESKEQQQTRQMKP